MLHRIKQFLAAVTARITPEDRQFAGSYLTPAEMALFWAMGVPEQRHSFNVAYRAGQLAAVGMDSERLLAVRSALLHDVGKKHGDMSIPDKVFTVLADRFCPRYARKWAHSGLSGFWGKRRQALYVYYYHAERGADLLKAAGTEAAVVEIVRRHHQPPLPEDCKVLLYLRQADSEN